MLKKLVHSAFRTPLSRAMTMAKPDVDPAQLSVMEAESCILIDTDDKVLGAASKKDCHMVQPNGQLLLHRAFSVFLFNSKNELLLHKRSPHKITFPNCYTNTCCSHPLWDIPAEREEEHAIGVRRAAQRRLAFELGIPFHQALPEKMDYITRFHYKSKGDDGVWGEHEIDYILFLRGDYNINPNENEVSDVRYVSFENFDTFLRELKDPVTPWFDLLSKSHLKYWWANLHRLDTLIDHEKIFRFQDSLN